jgi:hypothetical protein
MKTAAERNVLDVDAGREPQPLGGPVRSGAKASGGKVQRAWLRLGGGHSVGKGLPPFRGRSEYDRLNYYRAKSIKNLFLCVMHFTYHKLQMI